jgi:hypothetical protein
MMTSPRSDVSMTRPGRARASAGLLLVMLLAGEALAGPSLQAQWQLEPQDEPVPATTAHYLISNEARHDLFAAAITDRGGAYLGIGADQNYTLLALSRAERAYIIDHDREILELHRELGRRMLAAATPEALLRGLLDPADRPPAALARVWPALVKHLGRVAARRHEGRATTWLGDPRLYAFVRDRWRHGAVHLVLGDLVGDTSMPSIAAAAAARDLRFSVVYLSNAEETLPAPWRLAQHLRALPRTADAVLLRTVGGGDEPAADGLWSYQVQRLGAAGE